MYKNETENIEVYFICTKKGEEELVSTYYDPITNTHSWYFNTYLAYQYWKNNYDEKEIGELSKNLLTTAASKYIIYTIENEEYKNNEEYQELLNDLEKVNAEIENIIKAGDIIP